MRQIVETLTVAAAVANAVCLSQTKAGAGALVINGGAVVAGVATSTVAVNVLVTSDGNDSTRTYTVTGTNASGYTIAETITGPNATTVYTTRFFKTVTEVDVVGGATVGNITVGFSVVGTATPIPLDIHGFPQVSLQVTVTGTANFTVQQTLDNPFDSTINHLWVNHPDSNLVAAAASAQGNYAYIPAATRIVFNSGTGTVKFTVIQAGITGGR